MKTLTTFVAHSAMLLCFATHGYAQSLPAFSGAEGPGAIATGGRGGDVYRVTNLNPDKAGTVPGSLSYGINTAPSSGRTIVFDVGGTIYLAGQSANDTLRYSKSNITIAGQTAPGPGITIAGTGTKWTNTNLILRNITIRPNVAPVSYDAFSLQVKNSIVDHVTATWFTDEGISLTDAGANSTVQYANISQGLNVSGHAFGSIIATEVDGTHYSFHHNLYAHNKSRNPRLGSESGTTGAVLEFSNNVIYNWESGAGYSTGGQPSSTNFRSNYYIKGASSNNDLFYGANMSKVYEDGGNKLDSNRNRVIDGTHPSTIFSNQYILSTTPFAVNGTGTADSADVALQRVSDYVGANWQNRNPIDQAIIDTVKNVSGAILTTAPQASWATVMAQRTPVTRPANWDTDRDGMPDEWEKAHGLNSSLATGSNGNNGDFDNDGYTNIEEYINELGAWPAPTPLVFGNVSGNNRYALIRNWGNVWQPSRFDTAQIQIGSAVVDAVGQHAGTLSVAPHVGNNAALNVTAGWLHIANSLEVGTAGTGVVNHSGGQVITPQLTLGGSGAASGTYNLSGNGVLRVGTIKRGGAGGVFLLSGGTLIADRILMGIEISGGTFAPGDGIGTTELTGDLKLTSGTIELQIAGRGSSESDKITTTGGFMATGGSIKVNFVNGFQAVEGDSFDFIDFASVATSNASLSTLDPLVYDLPELDEGLRWNIQNFLSNGTLSVITAVPEPSSFGIFSATILTAVLRRRKRTIGELN